MKKARKLQSLLVFRDWQNGPFPRLEICVLSYFTFYLSVLCNTATTLPFTLSPSKCFYFSSLSVSLWLFSLSRKGQRFCCLCSLSLSIYNLSPSLRNFMSFHFPSIIRVSLSPPLSTDFLSPPSSLPSLHVSNKYLGQRGGNLGCNPLFWYSMSSACYWSMTVQNLRILHISAILKEHFGSQKFTF